MPSHSGPLQKPCLPLFILVEKLLVTSVAALANTNSASRESTMVSAAAELLQVSKEEMTGSRNPSWLTNNAEGPQQPKMELASDENQAGSGCNGQQFMDLDGETIKKVHVQGMQESQLDVACCLKCQQTKECEFWVRHRGIGPHECYLKKTPTVYHADDWMRGGWAPRNPLKSFFSDLSGKVVDTMEVAGTGDHILDAQCSLRCGATPGCQFWVREKGASGTKKCWLKKDPVKHSESAGKRGGWKPPPEAMPKTKKARATFKPTEPPPYTTGAPMTVYNPVGRPMYLPNRHNKDYGTQEHWKTEVDPKSGKAYEWRSKEAKVHQQTNEEWNQKRQEDQQAGEIKQVTDAEGHKLWEHHYYNPANPYTKKSSSLFALPNATFSDIQTYMAQQWRRLTSPQSQDDSTSSPDAESQAQPAISDSLVRRQPN